MGARNRGRHSLRLRGTSRAAGDRSGRRVPEFAGPAWRRSGNALADCARGYMEKTIRFFRRCSGLRLRLHDSLRPEFQTTYPQPTAVYSTSYGRFDSLWACGKVPLDV